MRFKTVLLAATLVLALGVQGAAALQNERKDRAVFNDISQAINHYANFTIFDDIGAEVDHGLVTLTGKVTMPFKRDEIEKRVSKVAGVTKIVNRITVLPVSTWDDTLRYRISRSIYGNPNFWNYASMASPPIHIVVENGWVTLTGVVQNEVDRAMARSLVTQFGVMSVANELKTDAEVREAIERTS